MCVPIHINTFVSIIFNMIYHLQSIDYQCGSWCIAQLFSAICSESISHIHRGYFRLVDPNRLDSAELPIPLLILWRRSEGPSWWSSVTLRHLTLLSNFIFTVIPIIHVLCILLRQLLLHRHRKLPIGPTTLRVPSMIRHTRSHSNWWSLLGGRMTGLG